jgi:hypothetical protein
MKNEKAKMKKTDQKYKNTRPLAGAFLIFYLSFSFLLFHFSYIQAQGTQTLNNSSPPVDITNSGFKLSVCDGPDLTGVKSGQLMFNGKMVTLNGSNPTGYVPCNFNGAMILVQHLIDVMIVLGVIAAMVGFCYAGFLYVKGGEKNISDAHKLLPKLVIGFIIMLSAWFIVYQILSWLTGTNGFSALLGTV